MYRHWKFILFLAVLPLFPPAASPVSAADSPAREVTFLFNCSSNGHLEACNCKMRPYGGLLRTATMLAGQRERYPGGIAVDAGDFLHPYATDILKQYVFHFYEALTFDFIAVGDQDFSNRSFMDGLPSLASGPLPFCAGNILFKEHGQYHQLTQPVKTFTRNGVSVAMTSIIAPAVFDVYPSTIKDALRIDPVDGTVTAFARDYRKDNDILVLVSQCGLDADRDIAARFPSIDVIISGHSQVVLSSAAVIGSTIIVGSDGYAQHLGRLTVRPRNGRADPDFSYELIRLGKEVPEDPGLRPLVDAYKNEIKPKP